MPELPKAYDPSKVEADIYRRWESSGYFNPDALPGKRSKPFVISMPPSNVTGELHIGHALGFTIQDILIRYHRMNGRAALWVPGTDHAAIATQVVVERLLREQGIERQKIGREKFLKHVWEWKKKYGSRINEQTRRMGASADWSREHFTMDEDLTLAVNTAFKKLYDDGLIYRGERMISWCPDCQTAISDLEVDHVDTPGYLWFIKYPLVDGTGAVTVATSRPETMLGDAAVAVHPSDTRYQAMVGEKVRLPVTNREVPIVADERVEKDFGTGAVKVTPAHDPLDFDIGQTHKLPTLQVIGFDGRMTEAVGPDFRGLTTEEARKKVIIQLRQTGFLEREEDYIHAVGYCSRSKTPIEPLVSLQWFLKTKPLAKKAISAVRKGKIEITPKRFEKVYFRWMENIRDWNISRQIWWGHRLPVWYKNEHGETKMRVSPKQPGDGWQQENDTLDTWFSSGLWTFSTLGWPKKTSDLRRFHPTDVMETAWDILFFWVARMIMFSEYFLHEVPFKQVYLHGLVLDAGGKKMSKSKGTGIDPLVMADTYGMDAVRMSLIVGNAPGQDFRLYEQKIEGYRNFANKLWNVARYTLSQPRPAGRAKAVSLADRWIDHRRGRLTADVTKSLRDLDLSAAGQALYDFVWHDLADWYVEASKVQPNPALLYDVLETALKLLHPFMPFITEAIWSELGHRELLMVKLWPSVRSGRRRPAVATGFPVLQETITALRNFRTYSQLPAGVVGEYVRSAPDQSALLAGLSKVHVRPVDRLRVDGSVRHIALGRIRFQFPRAYVERYEAWVEQERQRLTAYVARLEQKLADRRFTDNAPAEIVAEEKQKLVDARGRLLSIGP